VRFYSLTDNALSEAICLPLLTAQLTADLLNSSFFATSRLYKILWPFILLEKSTILLLDAHQSKRQIVWITILGRNRAPE